LPGGLVLVARGDDALGIGDDPAVVEEQADVILCGEQRTYVALEHEVRLDRPLDRLDDVRIGGVDQIAKLVAELALPVRQRVDVRVD